MSKIKKKRLKEIEKMLIEMSVGNFFYRIERSLKNDKIEALVITLNMMAEEIQEAMVHQGYANSHGTIKHIVQMSFIIDESDLIQATNQRACTILSKLHADIIGKPFVTFLVDDSKEKWQKTRNLFQQKGFYDTSLDLTFKTNSNLVVPSACYISNFSSLYNDKPTTLLTVVLHSNDQVELERDLKQTLIKTASKNRKGSEGPISKGSKQKIKLSFEDIKKLQKGRDIIINNLEKDFPSLKDFALQLGTNEFKLKYGFKELYGTSVYRFLKEERLRKSKMLIRHSELPLKSVSQMVGFKSFPHFSRAFKKRYGYNPSTLRKKSK